MNAISELMRLDAPCPKPQAIAFDGTLLWLGSVSTQRLYGVDPQHWTVRDEIALPGKPWGMTVTGDELRVICGETTADHRIIHRVIPGHGVQSEGSIPCPDDTGSQLSFDGDRLYVSQWYNKRILAIDSAGAVTSTIALPHEICGQTIVGGRFYCITTDDESAHSYYFTRVDARHAIPEIEDLAILNFDARGLAFDGERFWTNHREANQTVAFARPDA
jgi:hypothetical protein